MSFTSAWSSANGTRLTPARSAFFNHCTPSILACAITALIGSSALAQQARDLTPEQPQEAKELPEVHVTADRIEARVYDREEMDATPEGNRDLTSLISDNPAVRLNDTMAGNGNRGSLAPEQFSIHGESPFQNQFLIDGISGTNFINPQESALGLQVGRVPSFAQAYNLDTDMLEQVRVYDSRVPVEFGKFQGGVVDARIKTPVGSNTFSIKQSFNSSNLTQQQMPERVMEDWANGEPGYSSVWKKHFTSMQGDFKLTEDSNALVAFSRRESRIQRQSKVLDPSATTANGKSTALQTKNESDTVDNLMAKLHTNWGGGSQTNVLFKYADRQEDLVSNTYANSAWTNRQKSLGFSGDWIHQLDNGKLTATLGMDQLDSRRDSSGTEFVVQQFADKSLSTYTYGGFGNEMLRQRQYTGKLRMDWDSFNTGAIKHQLYAGLQLDRVNASFTRAQDVYSSNATLQADGSQKYNTRTRYGAGTVGLDYNSLAAYVSDTMQWRNLSLTTGLRVEHDDFLKNTNVAPRSRLDWDVQGNGQTQLGLGWARYYGQDLLGYALREGKSALVTYEVRNGKEVNLPGTLESNRFDGVKTPYSDEWAMVASQTLTPNLDAGFSYVHRNSRDSLTMDGNSTSGYFYSNKAGAKVDTVTLSLRSTRPWMAAGAAWNGRVDFSWQDKTSNHDSTKGWEAEGLAPDDVIEVNGVQMLRKDKPASQFYVPRELAVSFSGRWAGTGITWGNRLKWKSSRSSLAYTGTVKGVERYSEQRLASNLTWDTSVNYKPAQIKGLTLSVDILNVLNKQVPIAYASAALANNTRWQTGREIWLTAGYEF